MVDRVVGPSVTLIVFEQKFLSTLSTRYRMQKHTWKHVFQVYCVEEYIAREY